MNFNELTFQEKYIGKKVISGARQFVLSNDMPEKDKKFIYNMITKQVFDIFSTPKLTVNMSAPVTQKEIEIIEVKKVSIDLKKTDNLQDKTLKELRILFPGIKARSKDEFIKELKESKK